MLAEPKRALGVLFTSERPPTQAVGDRALDQVVNFAMFAVNSRVNAIGRAI
jgi:hypothetical protein